MKPDLFPLNVKLPIKKLTFDNQTNICHCPKFIQNCISTLETVKGELSLTTHHVLMKSTKLQRLNWELTDDEITLEEIASFQTNHSVKLLTVGEYDREVKFKPLSALLQKFDAVSCLQIRRGIDTSDVCSTKIKSLKLFCHNCDETFLNQIKLSFPNVENLEIECDLISRFEVDYDASHISNDPDLLMTIANQNWNLKRLHLKEINDVTIDVLKYLLQNCPSLKVLSIPDQSIVWNIFDLQADIVFLSGYVENGLRLPVLKIQKLSNGSFKSHLSHPFQVFPCY